LARLLLGLLASNGGASHGNHHRHGTGGRRWGALSAALGNDSVDLMIAATAMENGFTVVTRNASDFEPTGVAVLNPFSRRPVGKR
jgi:hypothetical protein